MASSDEEILIDKMSTKICQLTRVVYLLNNKYLDAQCNIEAIRSIYDKELTSIVRQANDYSNNLKKKITNLEQQNNIKDIYEKFTKDINAKFEKQKTDYEKKIIQNSNK